MAFCAFETHKASNISEKHPSVIIDFPTSLSNCFKFVQTKNWSMVSPYAAFATSPTKNPKPEGFGHLETHIPHYFTAHLKNLTLYGEKRETSSPKSQIHPWLLGSPYAPSSVAPNSCNTLLNSALAVARCSASCWTRQGQNPPRQVSNVKPL